MTAHERYDAKYDAVPLDPARPVLLLTLKQAAYRARVGIDRVRDWSLLPGFPVIREARLVRIHARLFDEWLADQARLANNDKDDIPPDPFTAQEE